MKNQHPLPADLETVIVRLYQQVGKRVRAARMKANVTQAQLAQAVEMTRSSIANLEAGRQRIPLHLLVWIAEVLNARPGDLLPDTAMFDEVLIMPDLSEDLADTLPRMRDFVQSTVAKVALTSRKET